MRSMAAADYVYKPWSPERRARASAQAKERLAKQRDKAMEETKTAAEADNSAAAILARFVAGDAIRRKEMLDATAKMMSIMKKDVETVDQRISETLQRAEDAVNRLREGAPRDRELLIGIAELYAQMTRTIADEAMAVAQTESSSPPNLVPSPYGVDEGD